MDGPKPCEFIGFGAMDVTKPEHAFKLAPKLHQKPFVARPCPCKFKSL